MPSMDLNKIDLNLLIVLHALLEARSVTRAARALNMSQPAVSRALAKLRSTFDDKLLVKSSGGMLPTARALELMAPLAAALDGIQDLFTKPDFDPGRTDRVFRLATTDYGAMAIVPPISRRLFTDAPNAGLQLDPLTGTTFKDVAEGRIDLALYTDSSVPAGFHKRDLFVEDYSCLVRSDHPLLGKRARRLTLNGYIKWPHVLVSLGGGRHGMVDAILETMGVTRKIVLWLPYFATAPLVVAKSDLILTLPTRTARLFADMTDVVLMRPPVEVSSFTYRIIWHERTHADPALIWLRRLIASEVRNSA